MCVHMRVFAGVFYGMQKHTILADNGIVHFLIIPSLSTGDSYSQQ